MKNPRDKQQDRIGYNYEVFLNGCNEKPQFSSNLDGREY